jgi:hypothetical protein
MADAMIEARVRIYKIGRSTMVLAVVMLILTAALWRLKRPGPDFRRYIEWANVAWSGDLFEIHGNTRSPFGVPYSQWSYGTGFIFAVGRLLTLGRQDAVSSALFIGWLASVLFWVALYKILTICAPTRRSLVALGLLLAVLGTHAGYYSFTHASESLSLACAAVVMLWLMAPRSWHLIDTVTVGAAASLLMAIRVQLGMYALLALAMLACKVVVSKSKRSMAHSACLVLAALVPVAIVCAQEIFVNRWMTGDFFSSPYTFGDAEFRSIDFLHPEFAAVLWHPWHGLLVYHPLYAVCVAALVRDIYRKGPWPTRLLHLALAGVLLMHVYMHAAWYCWWLGGFTFGMRGLAIASVVLVPVFIRHLDQELHKGCTINGWVAMGTLASLWSYLLLSQGVTHYFTLRQLVGSQWWELRRFSNVLLLATSIGVVVIWWRAWRTCGMHELMLRGIALFLACLAVRWVVSQAISNRYIAAAATVLVLSVAVPLLAAWLSEASMQRPATYGPGFEWVTSVGIITVFVCMATLFGCLTAKAENIDVDQARRGRNFKYTGSLDWDEVHGSYREYLQVPGFDKKKQRLAQFLQRWSEAHVSP